MRRLLACLSLVFAIGCARDDSGTDRGEPDTPRIVVMAPANIIPASGMRYLGSNQGSMPMTTWLTSASVRTPLTEMEMNALR